MNIRQPITVQERIITTANRPSGFDYLRLILSIGVVAQHAFLITLGKTGESTYWASAQFPFSLFKPVAMMCVPMFFSLSGFLIAGSLDRSKTLVSFFGLRMLRILPALVVEVVLSAIVLGPLLTSVSLATYLSDRTFFMYFFTLFGETYDHLPGVFESNPLTEVNGQIWTVPYELICYFGLGLLALFGVAKRRDRLLIGLMTCYAAQIMNTIFRGHDIITGATGSTVIMSFISGLLIYKYQEKLYWSFWICLPLGLISLGLCMIPNGSRFAPMPLAYLTIYLGLLNPPRKAPVSSGDYSFSLYLYGFPIQQACFTMSAVFRIWYWNFAASIILAGAIAFCSWHLVEQPALRLRGRVKNLEKWYLNYRPMILARLVKS